MKKLTVLFISIAAILSASAAPAATSSVGSSAAAAKPISMTLTAQQRGAAIGEFVRTWGAYVENTYGIDAGTWSKRMIVQFSRGDAVNIQRALQRTTFEGALAELNGTGKRFSDAQVISKMASLSADKSTQPVVGQVLGSVTNDLVYTPVVPCRLVDTRLTGQGPIPANGSRDFTVWGEVSYAPQGGSNTDCGLFDENPAAAVVNITAVQPSTAGFATAYAYNTTKPYVSSVNYAAGEIVNTLAIVDIANGIQLADLTLYTYGASNYTMDIVGFFDAPHATPLDCVTTTSSSILVTSGASGSVAAPVCGAGFTSSSVSCDTDQSGGRLIDFDASHCAFQNSGAGSMNITASSVCCRVPGR